MIANVINIQISDRIKSVETYYFATKLKEIAAMNEAGLDVINLGIGNPDLPPPPKVLEKLIATIGLNNNGYQSYTGLPILKNAFSDWYKSNYSVVVNPKENILPLIGSKEAIFHIAQAFLNKSDKVLIPNPGYPAYAATSKIAGAEIIYYPLLEENNWQPDFDFIEKQNLKNVKLIWCNYPNMPTGAKAKKETFNRLIDIGIENNILICHDNPYSFILNEKRESIFQNKKAIQCCIELNSLSKTYNIAGWRIGMLIAHPKIIEQVLKVKTNIDSGMYYGLQIAAIEALATEKSWHDEITQIYTQRRDKIIELFHTLQCQPNLNGSGMFVWAKIPDDAKNSKEYSEKILRNTQVFITPGFIFGSNGDKYLRASLCSDYDKIDECIKRIATRL